MIEMALIIDTSLTLGQALFIAAVTIWSLRSIYQSTVKFWLPWIIRFRNLMLEDIPSRLDRIDGQMQEHMSDTQVHGLSREDG